MQHGSSSFGDNALSRCTLFDFVDTKGPIPQARWGHSAVLLHDVLYLYGGVGVQTYDDLLCFELGKTRWQVAKVALHQEAPPAMYGQAACGVGHSMYIYGGRQGRKVLHTLYKYSTDSKSWEVCKAGSTAPPALAAHTLTAVGQHGIFCFGGQGKRVYNAVHKLDPSTCRWELVKTIGVQPHPRHGHTAVWDNTDSLIIFGGTNSTGQCTADVHVLSLSTGFWSSPQCTGDIPRARANHTAVMWNSHLMLIFGGCNPTLAGRFMNDVHVLDITTWAWYQMDSIGTPPAPRYWHSCVATEGRAFVFGGSNATQTFDKLFMISSDWSREINEVAGELAHMSSQSKGHTQAPSASQMILQLGDMLEQKASQGAADAEAVRHERTKNALQLEHQAVGSLSAEVAQLRLLQEEQQNKHDKDTAHARSNVHRLEEQCQQLTNSLRSAQNKNEGLSKAIQHHQNQTAKLASLQASLAPLQQQYASLQDQCIDSRKQHHHLQKQHTALQDQCSESQQKHRQLQEQYQECQGQLRTTAQELERSRSQVEQLRQAMSTKQSKQLSLQADSSLILQSGNASMQHQVTRYQCMPIWAPCGERNTVQSTRSCTDTDSHSELVKATAIRDAAAQLAVGAGDVDALTALPVSELHRLESTCQAVLGNVVAASQCKALAEVTRLRAQVDQLERSAEDSRSCSLCMEADKDVVLNCGHQMCKSCSKTLTQCPFCSAVISACIHVF